MNTRYFAEFVPTTTGPLVIQAVPADVTFSAVSTVSEATAATTATTTFSALDNAAVAPQAVPANVNYSVPPVSLAETTTGVVGTTTFSAISTGVMTVNPGSAAIPTVTYSAVGTLSTTVGVLAAGRANFSSVVTGQMAAIPNSATVTYDFLISGFPIVNQIPAAARTSFSSVATLGESLTGIGSVSYSARATGNGIANPSPANSSFGAIADVAVGLAGVGSAGYNMPPAFVATSLSTPARYFNFDALASVIAITQLTPGSVSLKAFERSTLVLRSLSDSQITVRTFDSATVTLKNYSENGVTVETRSDEVELAIR